MAWRFKASKYKNAAPIVPKPEACIRDISVGSYQTYGNNIAASAAFMAFNVDHNGSSLAVLPIDDCGRKSKTMPLLHAHTDTVTDMDFSPFHDGLLATGSQDCLVKLWHIPESGLQESLSNPQCVFSHKQRRVEAVRFHPTADCLLTSTSYTTLTLWDVAAQKEIFSNSQHSEVIQSMSWKTDGRLIVTSCKDKKLRVYDPRATTSITHTTDSHQSIKDSRVVWLGDSNRILTTGFDAGRLRQVYIRDIRKFSEPEKSLELDSSTGILMPLFDPDTNMLFLAGKGDITIMYMEVLDREPFLVEGIRHSGEQTKGACLVPKRALAVMQAEVNRLLQLTSSSVIPIMYQVPRKSYRDFHGDLFPDTAGCHSLSSASQWSGGDDTPVPRISLDPNKKLASPIHRGTLAQIAQDIKERERSSLKPSHPQPIVKNINQGWLKEKENSQEIVCGVKALKTKLETKGNDLLDDSVDAKNVQNGSDPHNVPPKPLPRASRNGSLSELNEEIPPVPNNPAPLITTPKPVARPRSSTTGVVPRLGPKPFTPPKLNFGVGSGASESDLAVSQNTDEALAQRNSPEGAPDTPPCWYSNGTTEHTNGSEKNGKADMHSLNEESTGSPPHSGSSSPEKPKTPSTSERRKVFESRVSSTESQQNVDGVTSAVDGVVLDDVKGDFDRNASQRSSIAERRRLYESRSMSIQDSGANKAKTPSPTPLRRKDSLKKNNTEDEVRKPAPSVQRQMSHEPTKSAKLDAAVTPTPKRTSTVFGRVSKFRHLKGNPGHKSTHIENIRNISRQISGECDGFHANKDRVAVPLSGPGGRIAVLELSRAGKLADGVIPALVHGANVMDFAWDPFNCSRLAVACDDGTIKLWLIKAGGLTEPTNVPDAQWTAHSEKIYFIKFHPVAKDVLASSSYDMTIRIWDLQTQTEKMSLLGHTDTIFCMAWSPCGAFCATVCKDFKIRVYEPRVSSQPVREGKGPAGSRGARIVWALDGNYIVVMGFDKVSERQLSVYKCHALNVPMNTIGLDVSPSILIPFYDEDSSTLFVTGRGDSTLYAFEVSEEAPFLCPLSHHRAASLHQGLSFLPKNCCDVASVEFAKALRLTNNSIEPLSFTVPRIKLDLFQDDLFPVTKVTWEPTMSANEWFSGVQRLPKRISLCPPGMDSLSDSQGAAEVLSTVAPVSSAVKGANCINANSKAGWSEDLSGSKRRTEQIQQSMSNRVEMNMKLEQDDMEGVDEKEWDD
ncbi:coronin-7 isoform X2 [Frankliniella occidentalis]|uniref:Coronin n=1 Tax=Frankliniella occidentalis TaxID=133901 RepID=A0A9C6XU49_FRAOC|nr:coronin-7 isoform X2 [Frankliniella occidentalis]